MGTCEVRYFNVTAEISRKRNCETMNKVLIIGAGAAGMMAAIIVNRNGGQAVLLDHNDQVGKKILSTGNGRCNFTNIHQEPIFYRSENITFPWEIVSRFTAHDAIKFFRELGIYSKNRNGYMYPYSDQASAILEALRYELERLDVEIYLDSNICEVQKKEKGFVIKTDQGEYCGDKLIIATGGQAAPFSGSDGSGYEYARQLGHRIVDVVPALVQLRCAESFYKHLAGVRVQGKVSLYVDDILEDEDKGEIQLTSYGISGIPVFQVSRYAARGIKDHKKVYALLDFMPDFSLAEFRNFIDDRIKTIPDRPMESFFAGLFNKKLTDIFISECQIERKKGAALLTDRELERIIQMIKGFRTKIISTNSFEQAQVTAGGVSTEEVDRETLVSKLMPDLYFAGEVLDVDGICGGYNLQWAWASGYIAGKGAAE